MPLTFVDCILLPVVSLQAHTDNPWMYAGNRTGPAWDSLRFGPEISSPVVSSHSSFTSKPPNASLLPSSVPAKDVPMELTKWQRAYAFHNQTKSIDIAYDGVFFQASSEEFCQLAHIATPEWMFLDDERFGAGLVPWVQDVVLSANAMARKLPGESVRM